MKVKPLEQQAYETWVASLCGDFNDAVLHGYHTWEKLPEKVKGAWKVTAKEIIKEVCKDCDHKCINEVENEIARTDCI